MSSVDESDSPESTADTFGPSPVEDAEEGASIADDLLARIVELDAIAWNLPGRTREILPDDLDAEPAA